jgi:hypothetical protein
LFAPAVALILGTPLSLLARRTAQTEKRRRKDGQPSSHYLASSLLDPAFQIGAFLDSVARLEAGLGRPTLLPRSCFPGVASPEVLPRRWSSERCPEAFLPNVESTPGVACSPSARVQETAVRGRLKRLRAW